MEIKNTSTISLVSSAASTLSDFSANGGGRSITCQHPFGFTSDMCAVMATNTTFYLTNITDVFNSGFTMSSKTLEGGNIFYTTGSNKQNQMISTDLYTEQTFVTSCENATGKGLIELHPFNGSVITASCGRFPASTYSTINSLLQGDIGNGVYDWMGYTQNSANQDAPAVGLMNPFNYAMRTATFPVSTGGANSIGRGMCFNRYQNKMIDFKRTGVSDIRYDYINSTGGVSVKTASVLSSISTALYGIICGQDFIVSDRGYIDLYSEVARNITTASAQWISFYSDNSLFLVSNVNSLDVFKLQVAPPTYVNASVFLRVNQTNATISGCPGIINSTSGAFVMYGLSYPDHCLIQLGAARDVNFTISGPGYISYNNKTNLALGNNNYYIYVSLNDTYSKTLNFQAVSAGTGDLITQGLSASLNGANQSFPIPFINGQAILTDVPGGNYTLTASAPGYNPSTQSVFVDPIHSDSITILMMPLGYAYLSVPEIQQATAWTAIPKSIEIARFNLGGVDVAGVSVIPGAGITYSLNQYQMIMSPSTICINQTIIVNYTAFKSDNESFNVEFSCDGVSSSDATSDYIKKVDGVDATWINGVVGCTWFGNDTGNKAIRLWARSPTYSYGINDFQSLLGSGLAYQYNVSVGGASCDQQAGVVLSSSSSVQYRLMLGVIIWIIASLAIGAFISALISGGPMVFGIAAGIVGIGVSIILALPFIGWLPPYFTLILTIFDVAAIAISVRMGMTG